MLRRPRNSTIFGAVFSLAGLIMVFLFIILPQHAAPYYREKLTAMRAQVSELQLTDLCLFTEARYTRHLSQADFHAPFQDHPLAFDHFPTGSLVLPPRELFGASGEYSGLPSVDSNATRGETQ
jgi:hypothetical protein